MHHHTTLFILGLVFLPVVVLADVPDFEQELAPLLIKRCVECHQGDSPAGGLRLTDEVGLRAGGDSGPALDFDSPEESYLLQRVHDGEMPPERQGVSQSLSKEELEQMGKPTDVDVMAKLRAHIAKLQAAR